MKLAVANAPLFEGSWESERHRVRAAEGFPRPAPPKELPERVASAARPPRCALVKLQPRVVQAAPERDDDFDFCPMPVGDGGAF